MLARFCCLLLATLLLSACSSYKLGNLLTAPPEVTQQQSVQETIALKVRPKGDGAWTKDRSREFARVVKQVFNQNGWRVTEKGDAPMTVEIEFAVDGYMYPEFTALYFLSVGTLPAKSEGYYTVNAALSVDGIEQDQISYTDGMVTYMTCYGPIGLMVPGTTHRAAFDNLPPAELNRQAFRRIAQNLAADIRAKYFSGNYQKNQI